MMTTTTTLLLLRSNGREGSNPPTRQQSRQSESWWRRPGLLYAFKSLKSHDTRFRFFLLAPAPVQQRPSVKGNSTSGSARKVSTTAYDTTALSAPAGRLPSLEAEVVVVVVFVVVGGGDWLGQVKPLGNSVSLSILKLPPPEVLAARELYDLRTSIT